MLREETELRKFGDIVSKRHCKRLNERAAARRARLVEHDAVDSVILYLEALYVLSADVDDEVNIGAEVGCRLEVRDGLNDAEVNGESRFYEVLAVACDRRAPDVYLRVHLAVYLF